MQTVAIGIPGGGYTIFDFTTALATLCAYRSNIYTLTDILTSRGCYIHRNRNNIVRMFLENTTSQWLLQLDPDTGFERDLIDNLLNVASTFECHLVAGWYMNIIEGKYAPVVYKMREDRINYVMPEGEEPKEVDAVGTGCLLTHRVVFEKIRRNNVVNPWFYFEEIYKGRQIEVMEDLTFCFNARKAGFSIYVDPKIRVKHYKLSDI